MWGKQGGVIFQIALNLCSLASSGASTFEWDPAWFSHLFLTVRLGDREVLCLGRLAEQSSLTGYEPKSLIEVSSEHTPINLPSRKGSLDTNLDDLATNVDASEVYDTTDMGRLTSPRFSQEREVNADLFSVSCSQT